MTLTNAIGVIPVAKAGDTMTGLLTLSGDPVGALDAATRQYVDAVGSGFTVKQACVAGSTATLTVIYANGALGVGATLTNNGAQAVFALDGQSPIVNDRVLIKNQTNDFENGIYTVTNVGSGVTNWILTRATDFDIAAEVLPGAFVIVSAGTVNGTTSWIQTATVATMGTDPIEFSQFTNSPSSYATKELDNLSSVAINAEILSDTDNLRSLGSATLRFKDTYTTTLKTGETAGNTLLLQAYDVDGVSYTTFGTLTANNTPTFALASAVTGTTQAPLDNSTKLSTTAYTDAAVAAGGGGGGATKALDNLAAVAINVSLVSDTDNTDDLGTAAKRWQDLYAIQLKTGVVAADTLTISARDVDGAVDTAFITLTANNTPTCVLANGVTGSTQAASDNSTKLATTAYVDAQVLTTGASKALDNLASVAVNVSLVSDTDNIDDLGTAAKRWQDLYAVEIKTGTTAAQTTVISARDVDGVVDTPFITLTANNTPTCVLASAVTATTQAALDNSTKLATTQYVESAVAAGGSGANTALSNLAAVAINTSLVSDTDNTDDLGTAAKRWQDLYALEIKTGTTAAQTTVISARDVDGAVDTPFITLTANNTPTCVLASSITGTTQAPLDNSTKLSTTAYTDAAVAAAAGGGTFKETEIDFTTALVESSFTITDAGVGATSKIVISISGNTPTSRNADEIQMESFYYYAVPAAGTFSLFIRSLQGPVYGKYKVFYTYGV